MEAALLVYNEAILKRGILVDSEMALPLLEAFCYPRPGQSSNMDRSMEIYQDIIRSEALLQANALALAGSGPVPNATSPPDSPTTPKPLNDLALTPEEEATPLGPSVEVYEVLLHGISRSSNEKIDHKRAWDLIKDMRARGVHFSNTSVIAHVKRFMTKATDHEDAFKSQSLLLA
jgi:hypothetical protein